jgi:tetratricopeptide (TPR) repeat protein
MAFLVVFLLTFFVFGGPAFAQLGTNPVTDFGFKAASAADLVNYGEARNYYLQELDLLAAKDKQGEAASVYTDLGEITQIHGGFATAEAYYKKALDLLKSLAQPNDWRLVAAMDDLGWLYVTWGKLIDGSRLMDIARTKAEHARPNDPRLIRHFDAQAAYLVVTGRYSEAQKDWNRALEIGKFNYGSNDSRYDNILIHFGQGAALFGDYQAAAQMFRRFLEIEDGLSNIRTTARAVAAGELAHVYLRLHKFSEARTWFDQAIGAFNSNPDEAPLVHSIILSYFGDFFMAQEDWSNAQLQYRQALSIQQKVLGESDAVAASMISLSKALRKLHLKDEAKDLVARAKTIVAAEKNPVQDQTVDVLALRNQPSRWQE